MPRFEEAEVSLKVEVSGGDTKEFEAVVDLDFEVFCAKCGYGLCHLSTTRKSRRRGEPQVEVGLCPRCIEDIKEEAFEAGRQAGVESAMC